MNVLPGRLVPFQASARGMIKALSLLDRVGDEVFAFFNLAPIMSDEGSHMLQSGRKGRSLCPRKGQIKPRGLFARFHLRRGLTLGHDELLRWCRGGAKMLYRSSPTHAGGLRDITFSWVPFCPFPALSTVRLRWLAYGFSPCRLSCHVHFLPCPACSGAFHF